jgi:hypothetical protein
MMISFVPCLFRPYRSTHRTDALLLTSQLLMRRVWDEWHCHVSLRFRAGLARKFPFLVGPDAHPERLRQLGNLISS